MRRLPVKNHRVVILGGGFGGFYAAKPLRRLEVQVTLIDRRNFHLFQPLLYQVATGALSPGEIASPLRFVLRRNRNTEVLLAEAIDIDVDNRMVLLRDGSIGYDTLIVAAGAEVHYFGHSDWEPAAPGLKTIEDATEIRRRLLYAFEAAERESDPARRHAWLTFVIVGGGPTGVELAGALGEIAKDTLRHDFRHINPAEARILLFEGGERILSTFPPQLSARAEHSLIRLGVRTRTRALVRRIDPEGVTVRSGNGEEYIPARTILWAAGVRASSLGAVLARRSAAPLDGMGRVIVRPDLTVPGHPEIFVIGDLAHFAHQTGQPLPAVAPVAMQQGKYAARSIERRLMGEPVAPFRYRDKGNLATIGRAAAVADLGWFRFSGLPAWIVWLFVHLLYLVEFDNRLLVMIQWTYSYVTRNRGAR
jgi:NADH dehydrogenase